MTAALMEPGWREQSYRANGIDFHVVEAGRAGDPVLVLLHGFPEFWWTWRKQITPLAEAGFHVVAPDLRGYNRSTAPREVWAYTLDTLATDIVALADVMGARRFQIVGHDWGAVIGWWLAALYPDRVERAVLLNGPHPDAWAALLRHPAQALRSSYIALFQLPWLPEAALRAFDFAWLKGALRRSARPGAFEPGAFDRYAEAWSRPGALTAMLGYYRAMRLRRAGKEPTRVVPPTLVIWGDEDRFLGRPIMEASVALCDEGRFLPIEGASHWLHLEQPERVVAEILAFIRP